MKDPISKEVYAHRTGGWDFNVPFGGHSSTHRTRTFASHLSPPQQVAAWQMGGNAPVSSLAGHNFSPGHVRRKQHNQKNTFLKNKQYKSSAVLGADQCAMNCREQCTALKKQIPASQGKAKSVCPSQLLTAISHHERARVDSRHLINTSHHPH